MKKIINFRKKYQYSIRMVYLSIGFLTLVITTARIEAYEKAHPHFTATQLENFKKELAASNQRSNEKWHAFKHPKVSTQDTLLLAIAK